MVVTWCLGWWDASGRALEAGAAPPVTRAARAAPGVASSGSTPLLRVRARALQGEGTVQLSFDEAPPSATPPALRQAIPDVSFTSPGSGRATLRVRVQVVPRVQKAEQSIVLSVGRTSAGRKSGT